MSNDIFEPCAEKQSHAVSLKSSNLEQLNSVNNPYTKIVGNESLDTAPSDLEANSDYEEVVENAFEALGILDKLLFVFVLIAMAIGILLGNFVPSTGPALQKGEFVGVSIPIAIGLIFMMYPILCNVEFEILHRGFKSKDIWAHLGFSFIGNWIVGPFLMLGLAWACLPDKPELRDGLILVGIARCIAMVLIWNRLAGGDANFGAILVSLNSILQMILYAPYAIWFIKVIGHSGNDVTFSYSTVAKSVAVFLGIPLGAGIVTRFTLRPLMGKKWYDGFFMKWMGIVSLVGLLFIIIVLFASQGARVVQQIVSVVRVAVPLTIYFFITFFSTAFVTYKLGYRYNLAVALSFTASSNNFELAIAIAVATFGHQSDQALASTVGPLIEVPVLLAFVYVIRYIAVKVNWK